MGDLEQRVKALEAKVKILEETLETIKNMQMSEQMQEYILAKTKTLKMAELINSLSDKPELDLSNEQNTVKEIQKKKNAVDEKIANAISEKNNYSEKLATSIDCFEYKIENGKDNYGNHIEGLSQCIGKGIRIIAYNGFDCKFVNIPKSIDGLPVTSIGEKAFLNTQISEIALPNTIKAILSSAFEGCKELAHINIPDSTVSIMESAFQECVKLENIDLPNGLSILGEKCFKGSGLTRIVFPNSLRTIEKGCCEFCFNLKTVILGDSVERIEAFAFDAHNIRIMIPSNVKSISNTTFGCEKFLSNCKVECAFKGTKTNVIKNQFLYDNRLGGVKTIYCLPGSAIQKYAREHNIPIKPLSEFKLEE